MSPVFSHGSLRLYLLSLLDDSPKHGYELIVALSDRFGGTYSPSPGTIYPRLAKLEDEGLATKTVQGRKTVYAITERGREELSRRQSELDALEDEVTDSVRRLADEVRVGVNEALRTLKAELAAATREASRAVPEDALRDHTAREARAASNAQIRQIDVMLTEFRHQLRSELSLAASRGDVPPELAASVRAELDCARRRVIDLITLR